VSGKSHAAQARKARRIVLADDHDLGRTRRARE
jgi:hypothetical protein